jgi:hypothetical protein
MTGTTRLTISPKTRIGELLDAYPQLEPILLSLSPAFARLKNPVLRKTVARIATLQQAAMVGGLKTDELVNRLRKETGQAVFTGETADDSYLYASPPDWFDFSKIIRRFDATPVINAGGSPLSEIISLSGNLQPGEILELSTPFVPAPVIEMLRDKGFQVFSMKKDTGVLSYVEGKKK